MTQEQKELLFKDLCARLPYKVMLNCDNTNDEELWAIDSIGLINHDYYINEVKPYLFPLSNITNQQLEELQSYMINDSYGILYHTIESYDYLYRNNIDVRRLILQGLAIDATGLNIY